MSLATAWIRTCIPFLLVSSLVGLDYQVGQQVHRKVGVHTERIDCQITADLAVVETDPLKLRVFLRRIQSNGPIYRGDTNDEPHDSRHAWWKSRRLKQALDQPLYVTIDGEQCLLAEDDREMRFALWPELLRAIDNGWLFSLLFGPEFILEGHDVREGLTFLYNDRAFTVQRITEEEVIGTLDETAELIWNRRNPLLFQAESAKQVIDSTSEEY